MDATRLFPILKALMLVPVMLAFARRWTSATPLLLAVALAFGAALVSA